MMGPVEEFRGYTHCLPWRQGGESLNEIYPSDHEDALSSRESGLYV